MGENLTVREDNRPETATYATVDNAENVIREWEARINDASTGGKRWMNQSTVTTLLNAIRSDSNFSTVAFLSLADPSLTHEQLINVYRDPQQGGRLFHKIFGGITHVDHQVLTNIDSDLAALCLKDDRTRNSRVFALRACVAWLDGDDDAMREYANMAVYLDQNSDEMEQGDLRVPNSTDTLTVIMAAIVAMRAQAKLDDEWSEQWKEYVNSIHEPASVLTEENMGKMEKTLRLKTPQLHTTPLVSVRI